MLERARCSDLSWEKTALALCERGYANLFWVLWREPSFDLPNAVIDTIKANYEKLLAVGRNRVRKLWKHAP